MMLSVLLRLGRVSNLPTVWSNVIAGAVLSGASFDLNSLLVLGVAFSAFYIGGMFLNDAFDAEFDATHRPERPIPSGAVDRGSVFFMGGGLLLVGILLIGLHSLWVEGELRIEPILYASALAVGIVWYNADHKQNVIGPVLMGLNRVYVYATTAYALTPQPERVLWVACGAVLLYLIGLTTLARKENAERVHNPWPAALIVLALGYPWVAASWGNAAPDWSVTLVLIIALLFWVVRSVVMATSKKGQTRTQPAIGALIAGISLLDASCAAVVGQTGWSAVAVVAFVLCLFAQSFVSGT